MAHPQKCTDDEKHIGRPRCSIVIGGSDLPKNHNIHRSPIMPLKLQRIIHGLGLSTSDLAREIIKSDGSHVSRSTISLTLNRGYIPGTVPNYQGQIEEVLKVHGVSDETIATAWEPESGADVIKLRSMPDKSVDGKNKSAICETLKEAEMLTPTTMKHFRMFRNPFMDDVQNASDVFMSESHSYAHAAMVDAAHTAGFVAVCAECGAGKSTIKRKLIDELNDEGDVRIIEPQIIDKGDLTASHILDSIILDLDPSARPNANKETKPRQVKNALLASYRNGMRHVILIEEAHDISVPMMKQLKRLWEIQDGYRKVIGIVLIGQTELQMRLNRNTHPEMREVILRCLIATLDPLGKADCESYIKVKFGRVGKENSEIMSDGCIDAIMDRLTSRNGISSAYPLYINNLLVKSMNIAAQIGAPIVTPEIIQGV